MKLTLKLLCKEAKSFCRRESSINHPSLFGVTDGKAVGTYVEHKFKEYLNSKYEHVGGSSTKGIDLPDPMINTDIKVTSIKQPQSSCPFKNTYQKVYGLDYNLLIFVYEKNDYDNQSYLEFKHCTFMDSKTTGDYTLTKHLIEMVEDKANKEDIIGYLIDRNVPGDEITLNQLADKILSDPPKQGYLTISNALQWRLQYKRAINLENEVSGVYNYDKI